MPELTSAHYALLMIQTTLILAGVGAVVAGALMMREWAQIVKLMEEVLNA